MLPVSPELCLSGMIVGLPTLGILVYSLIKRKRRINLSLLNYRHFSADNHNPEMTAKYKNEYEGLTGQSAEAAAEEYSLKIEKIRQKYKGK